MEYAKAQFAKGDDQSDDGPLPELHYLWAWFDELSDWREFGTRMGALPHCEIESWARMYRLEIFPTEVDVLRQIDRAFRIYCNTAHLPQHEPGKLTDGLRALKEQADAKKVTAKMAEEKRAAALQRKKGEAKHG